MAARTAPRAGRIRGFSRRSSLFGLAPGGVCRASELPRCWCALTAPFHPYRATSRRGLKVPRGGLLSVALSRALRPADVIGHPVLWSPDFPPAAFAAGGRPARLKTTFHDSGKTAVWGTGSGETKAEVGKRKAAEGDTAIASNTRLSAFRPPLSTPDLRFPTQFALPPLGTFGISTPPESLSPHQAHRFLCRRPIHA